MESTHRTAFIRLPVARRTVLGGMLASGALVGSKALATAGAPIAETTSGRVRGEAAGGVEVFRGIPYAASTAGLNRYRPPQPVEPWSGVRDALAFGPSAPQQPIEGGLREIFAELEPTSEDCLSLNVYTPRAGDNGRRPVMVWLHGGGWRAGAGSAPGIRGFELARLGEVVLVTINHRLDVLGFLHIDDGDERFADAGNLGVLDMIAALEWVRDNAAAFGGDPGNVTIFGQSGGGSKVTSLLAAPAARGLFAKAIAMSCSGCLLAMEAPEADSLAAQLAANLGLARLTGEALQALPVERIVAAGAGRYRPMIDGRTFTRHFYHPDAPPSAAGIPLLVGNVESETRAMLFSGGMENFSLGEEEVARRVARYVGSDDARTRAIIEAYRADYPGASPSDLLGAITTDYNYVRNTRRLADLHAAVAPTYSYLFTRRTPVMGGILHSPHEAEVPFIFGTTEVARELVGEGADIEPLTRLMIATWTRFARTGDPNHAGLPQWPRHRPGDTASMLLDTESRYAATPGATARIALDGLPFYEYSMPTSYTHP